MRNLVFIITLTLLGPALFSGNSAAVEKADFLHTFCRTLGKADSRDFSDFILSRLRDRPCEAETVLCLPYLHVCVDAGGFAATEQALRNALGRVTEQGASGPALRLRLALDDLYRGYAPEKAAETANALSPLRHWKIGIVKPLLGSGDIYREGLTPPDSLEIIEKNITGEIFPGCYVHGPGTVRARTLLKIESEARIHVLCRGRYACRINGQTVFINEGISMRNTRCVDLKGSGTVELELDLWHDEDSSFRVLLTGMDDRIIPAPAAEERSPFRGSVAESEPFPGESMKKQGHILRGLLAGALGSPEAAGMFRMALDTDTGRTARYLLADALLHGTGVRRDGDRWQEGWQHMGLLGEGDNPYAPASWNLIERDLETADPIRSVARIRSFLGRYPGYLPAWESFFVMLGRTGEGRDFDRSLATFRDLFPRSPLGPVYEAYVKGEGYPELFIRLMGKGDKRHLPQKTDRYLSRIQVDAGDLKGGINRLSRWTGIGGNQEELYDMLYLSGEYYRLRSLLLKEAALYPRPGIFLRLGLLDRAMGRDGLHFFYTALSREPSFYGLGDYIRYLEGGNAFSPCEVYRNPAMDDLWNNQSRAGDLPSVSGREYIVQVSGRSSRVLAREILNIRNGDDLERYGEYRIPFSGEVSPLWIRTRGADGTFSDSWRLSTAEGHSFFTINGLVEGARVDISYIVEGAVRSAGDSGLLYLPPVPMQGYGEGVGSLFVTVKTDGDLPLAFPDIPGLELTADTDGDGLIYRITAHDLPPVTMEGDVPGGELCLPHLMFASSNCRDYFFPWYSSLLRYIDAGADRDRLVPLADSLRGENLENTVSNVYHHVNGDLPPDGNMLFVPENPMDVNARGRGTIEDRVLLARAILGQAGIASYPVALFNEGLPPAGDYLSPDCFRDMVLLVPVEGEKRIWLDFSSQWLGCGFLSFGLQGRDGLVVLPRGVEQIKTPEDEISWVTTNCILERDDSRAMSVDYTLSLSGVYGETRLALKKVEDRRNLLGEYLADRVDGSLMEEYQISGFDSPESDLVIRLKGSALSPWIPVKGGVVMEGVTFRSDLYDYLSGPSRLKPLMIGSPVRERSTYRIAVPEEYEGVSLEKNEELRSAWGRAEYRVVKKSGSRDLVLHVLIHVGKGVIGPADYPDFYRFCMAIRSLENRRLFLQKPL